jgi:hypothetical protein
MPNIAQTSMPNNSQSDRRFSLAEGLPVKMPGMSGIDFLRGFHGSFLERRVVFSNGTVVSGPTTSGPKAFGPDGGALFAWFWIECKISVTDNSDRRPVW